MNILINLSSSEKDSINPYHGGNEYCNIVSEKILEINQGNKLFFYCRSKKNISEHLINSINGSNDSLLIEELTPSIKEIVEKFNIDRIFDPLGLKLANSFNLEKNIHLYYVIHGLRPIEMPSDISEYFLGSKTHFILKNIFQKFYLQKKRKFYKAALQDNIENKHLITVSEHTKYSMISEFVMPEDRIKVFYSPQKKTPRFSEQDEKLFFKNNPKIVSKNYFLILSAKRWEKNSRRAIIALDELISKGQLNKKVLVIGGNKRIASLPKNKKFFTVMDYAGEIDLEILLKNAFCLIYPSLNEGFGYPPIEAMKYSTAVINSNISAIPEIVQNGGLGFYPFSKLELKSRILQIQNDETFYNKITKKGYQRYIEVKQKQDKDLLNLCQYILT